MKIYKKMVVLAVIFSILFFLISPVSFSSAEDSNSKSSKSEGLLGDLVFANIVRRINKSQDYNIYS